MAQRQKRSISLAPELAAAIEGAAARERVSFSAWLAETADRRLRLEAGQRALAEWENEHGSLSPEERAEGRARARALLGRPRDLQRGDPARR